MRDCAGPMPGSSIARATLRRSHAAGDVCRKSLALDPSLVETEKALASIAPSCRQVRFGSGGLPRAGQSAIPQDADAYIGLGDALAGLGKGAEAEASYRQAVAVEPAYWGAHSALGDPPVPAGQDRRSHRRPAQGDGTGTVERVRLEQSRRRLQMKGDFGQALEAYDHSLQLEPSKDAYSNLATTYYYLGRFPEASPTTSVPPTLGEHDYVIQGNLADALWQVEGRRDDAIARYRSAIQLAESELEATPGRPDTQGAAGLLTTVGRASRSARSATCRKRCAAARRCSTCSISSASLPPTRATAQTALRAVAELVRLGTRRPCCVPHLSSAVCCRTPSTRESSAPG